jgi:hypothetical protein
MRDKVWASLLLLASMAFAQDRPPVSEILKRLDRLEEQNRQLLEEIRSLRQQLAAAPVETATAETATVPIEERVAVTGKRQHTLHLTKLPIQCCYCFIS